ncbi:MAG: DUF3145 domain-containing protein, partial [Kitasatospora sp.]|nr:DUF3145 domain-containing protein [Kitasatospora sp.]
MTTRGVLYIHSAPRALCPHVEWAVAVLLAGTGGNHDDRQVLQLFIVA